jgi:hypothetical protein
VDGIDMQWENGDHERAVHTELADVHSLKHQDFPVNRREQFDALGLPGGAVTHVIRGPRS